MFTSVNAALRWAFLEHERVIVNSPAINRMYGKRNGYAENQLLEGLSRLDKHNQAENIIGIVRSIGKKDPAYVEIIFAEYGFKRNYSDMEGLIKRVIGTLGTGEHKTRGVQDIILLYFGENIGYRKIREDLNCSMQKVYWYKESVFKTMELIRRRAIAILHDELSEKQLIFTNIRLCATCHVD